MMDEENPEGLEELDGVMGMDAKPLSGRSDSSRKQERTYLQQVCPSLFSTLLTKSTEHISRRESSMPSWRTCPNARTPSQRWMKISAMSTPNTPKHCQMPLCISAQKLNGKARPQSSMKATIDRFARRQKKLQNDLAHEMGALFQAHEIAVKRGVSWSDVVISQNRHK